VGNIKVPNLQDYIIFHNSPMIANNKFISFFCCHHTHLFIIHPKQFILNIHNPYTPMSQAHYIRGPLYSPISTQEHISSIIPIGPLSATHIQVLSLSKISNPQISLFWWRIIFRKTLNFLHPILIFTSMLNSSPSYFNIYIFFDHLLCFYKATTKLNKISFQPILMFASMLNSFQPYYIVFAKQQQNWIKYHYFI